VGPFICLYFMMTAGVVQKSVGRILPFAALFDAVYILMITINIIDPPVVPEGTSLVGA